MSKNIITNYLLDGKLNEKLTFLTDELKCLLTIVYEASDKLTTTLFLEQKLVLDAYRNAEETYNLENLDRYFSEDFKTGLLIGLETRNKVV